MVVKEVLAISRTALWVALGVLTYAALIAVLFYLFPYSGDCMKVAYLPC
jgi:hypothetical protein